MAANEDLSSAILEADGSQRRLVNQNVDENPNVDEDANVNQNMNANANIDDNPVLDGNADVDENANVNEDANRGGAADADLDEEPQGSDAESAVGGPDVLDPPNLFGVMIGLPDGCRIHDRIKGSFLSGLGDIAAGINVVSIYKNGFHSLETQARLHAFEAFEDAVKIKNGGTDGAANVKYAWYAAAKSEIQMILAHGFCEQRSNGLFGQGVYLTPENSSLEAVRRSIADEDGLRYLMLCRVILGRSELIEIGSDQHCPTSSDFDSGVDSLESPKKYIIWSGHMGTHILPEFVLSFQAPDNLQELVRVVPPPSGRPTSPWIPLPALLAALSNVLPPSQMHMISMLYRDFRERRRITRFELIQQIRRISGDQLVARIIKAFRDRPPSN